MAAQQASDAADARRWAGEADSLAQQVASLTADLEAARQQLAAAQDAASALQQQQGSTERRVVELEGGSAELSQQLTVRNGAVVGPMVWEVGAVVICTCTGDLSGMEDEDSVQQHMHSHVTCHPKPLGRKNMGTGAHWYAGGNTSSCGRVFNLSCLDFLGHTLLPKLTAIAMPCIHCVLVVIIMACCAVLCRLPGTAPPCLRPRTSA